MPLVQAQEKRDETHCCIRRITGYSHHVTPYIADSTSPSKQGTSRSPPFLWPDTAVSVEHGEWRPWSCVAMQRAQGDKGRDSQEHLPGNWLEQLYKEIRGQYWPRTCPQVGKQTRAAQCGGSRVLSHFLRHSRLSFGSQGPVQAPLSFLPQNALESYLLAQHEVQGVQGGSHTQPEPRLNHESETHTCGPGRWFWQLCPKQTCQRVEPCQEASHRSLERSKGLWELRVSLLGMNDHKDEGGDFYELPPPVGKVGVWEWVVDFRRGSLTGASAILGPEEQRLPDHFWVGSWETGWEWWWKVPGTAQKWEALLPQWNHSILSHKPDIIISKGSIRLEIEVSSLIWDHKTSTELPWKSAEWIPFWQYSEGEGRRNNKNKTFSDHERSLGEVKGHILWVFRWTDIPELQGRHSWQHSTQHVCPQPHHKHTKTREFKFSSQTYQTEISRETGILCNNSGPCCSPCLCRQRKWKAWCGKHDSRNQGSSTVASSLSSPQPTSSKKSPATGQCLPPSSPCPQADWGPTLQHVHLSCCLF